MQADAILLIKDSLKLLTSIVPQKLGLSVAIIELIIPTFGKIILTSRCTFHIKKAVSFFETAFLY